MTGHSPRGRRARRRAALAVAALAVVAAALVPTAAQAAPAVDGELSVSGTPGRSALAADGNVYVVLTGATNDIARVAPDGSVTEFDPGLNNPHGIASGPDGNLWVTQTGGVAKIDPANPAVATPTAIAEITDPRGIAAAADGNLWAASGDKVIRIPPANPAAYTAFTVAGLGARGVSAGPGGVWVADFAGGRIVNVSPDGVPTPYDVGGGPQDVAGGTGQVAYSNPGAMPQEVGRIAPGGTAQKTPLAATADPFGVALGTDGAYWFANFATGDLGRLTTGGAYSTLGGFSAASGPRYLTVGANNTLWVSLETAKKVARVTDVVAPSGGGGNGNGTGGGTGEVAPRFTKRPTATPKRFRVGRASTPRSAAKGRRRAPAGTTFRYGLSEAATVTIVIKRRVAGRRVRGRCVKPTRRNRRARRCVRLVRVGTLRRASKAGTTRVRFTGRIGRRALKPGRYVATFRARDADGMTSSRRNVALRIVRR